MNMAIVQTYIKLKKQRPLWPRISS